MPAKGQRITPAFRFWAFVDKKGAEECWPWKGSTSSKGYGWFKADPEGNAVQAHRYVWELSAGKSPGRLQVLHICDSPSCVNPKHLYLGTHAANMHDRDIRGRTLRGEKAGRAKLTKENVLTIKRLYRTGKYTGQQLGKRFNVHQNTVYSLLSGNSWKHLQEIA